MFNIAKISDIVQVEPKNFGLPGPRLVEDTLNAKYADKVIPEVGLVLGVYTLDTIGDGLIGHSGTGIVNLHTDFSLLIFRPHLGEILRGKVSHMDSESGIWLTLDFFDEINIPPEHMFENMEWRDDASNSFNGVWVWKFAEGEEFFVDENEILAVRVEEERWVDVSLEQQERGRREKEREKGREVEGEEEPEIRQPYAIVASMGATGLGPEFWWAGGEDDGMGDVEEEQ